MTKLELHRLIDKSYKAARIDGECTMEKVLIAHGYTQIAVAAQALIYLQEE